MLVEANEKVVAEKRRIRIYPFNQGVRKCETMRDHASKKVKSISFSNVSPYFGVCCFGDESVVEVYDIRTGESLNRISLSEECSSLCFSAISIFVSTVNGEVIEFSLDDFKEKSRFIADKQGLSCICISNEDDEETPLLATGRNSICVWRGQKRVSKYSGHSSNITSMAFVRGDALLSGTDQDRFICIWPGNVKKSRAPIMILNCSEPPSSLACGPRLLEGDEASVVALSQSGTSIFVWRVPSTTEGMENPPKEVNCNITASNILGCDFTNDGEVLCLIRKKDDEPLLTKIHVTSATNEGGLITNINLNTSENRSEEPGISTNDNDIKLKRLDRSQVVTIGDTQKNTLKRLRSTSVNSVEDDRPMIARLSEYSDRLDQQTATVIPPKLAAPNSLSIALDQALQTEDKDKIEAVLQISDIDIISQTIQRIPALKIPSLIRELAIRLQGKPGRAVNLLNWLLAVLDNHFSFLTTDPSAREALRSVYAIADSRVQLFSRLLRLKGRLDLVLARNAASNLGNVTSAPNKPEVFNVAKG